MITSPTNFASYLTKAGIPIPKAAAEELRTYNALADARTIDHTTAAASDAMTGKVTADTALDSITALADHIGRQSSLDEALRTLQQPIVARWYAALRGNQDKLIGSLKEAAREPIAIVQEAGRHFGTAARADDVLAAGVEAVKVFEQLNEAIAALDLIRNIRVQFAELFGHGEPDVSWWIAAAEDAADYERAERAYFASGNAFHNLAEAGYTLAVNTEAEAIEVRTGAAAATQRRLDADTQRRAKEYRDSLPVVPVVPAEGDR